MEPAKNPLQLKTIIIVLIAGLFAFLLYVYLYVNPIQVAETLLKTNLWLYSVAFLVYFGNTVFSSIAWYRLLNNLQVEVSRTKVFLFTWVGLFFEATVPQLGWSAEISKTYMLTKDTHSEAGKVGASVVWQKIFNMSLTIVTLSIGLGLVLSSYKLPILAAFVICLVLILSILTLGVVLYVSLKPSATKTILNLIIKIVRIFRKNWNAENFLSKMEGTIVNFHEGIAQLKARPRELIIPLICSICSFTLEVSVFFITFAALGEPIRLDAIFIVFTLTGVLQTIGIAFFGFPELVMTLTLTALNINPDIAVSLAILTRIVNLWFRIAVSYVALQWAGVKIIRQNRSKKKDAI
jgi:uncharacterized protein (TIRG00374 family)